MKKIFKKILIVSGLVLLIYVFFLNFQIKGVWIGTSRKLSESKYSSSNESILIFNLFSAYKIDPFEPINYPINKKLFLRFGDYLFAKPLDEEFENIERKIKLSNDSLSFKSIFSEYKIDYYRIPDSLKYKSNDKIELANKFFKIKSENLIDTVFFGERIMVRKKFNDYLNKINWDYDGYWKIVDVNGFKIFLGDFNPMIVRTENSKTKFYLFNIDSFKEIELEEFRGERKDVNHIIDNFNKND